MKADQGSQEGLTNPFKFEEYWTRYDECVEIINNNGDWNPGMSHLSSLSKNLSKCSDALSKWGKGMNYQRRDKINECKRALKDAYSNILMVNFDVIHGLEFELDKLMEEEEIYWKQRSMEDWLKWGDRNSKWFHKKATIRRKSNEIYGIVDDNGLWYEDPSLIENTFISYFENLFESSNPDLIAIENSLDGLVPKVNQSMNNSLMAPFTRTEIENAIKQMFPTKAPGPDGYLAIFIRNIGIL